MTFDACPDVDGPPYGVVDLVWTDDEQNQTQPDTMIAPEVDEHICDAATVPAQLELDTQIDTWI